MTSPARRFREQTLARLALEKAGGEGIAPERPATGAEATQYELILAELGEDLNRLKDIQSTERKIDAKREMIARYDAHVDATLQAATETNTALQDEVLVTMMLWNIDIANFTRALDLAEHVLRYGLRLPERFQRTPATLLVEEIAEAALAAHGQAIAFDIAVLQRTEQLTADQDMPDIVRAKLAKALGFHMVHFADAQDQSETAVAGAGTAARTAALEYFRRALALEPKIGVKKDIERLQAALAKAAPPPPQE
jgi:hypothetical protein